MEELLREMMIEDPEILSSVFGQYDENIKMVEGRLNVDVLVQDQGIQVRGKRKAVDNAVQVIEEMVRTVTVQGHLNKDTTDVILTRITHHGDEPSTVSREAAICFTTRGKPICSKTQGQKKYIEAIKNNDIVFGIGPAGTGKTYLAMAMAITAFKNGEVDRLVLTRPAVEAGEKLGFLPGDLQDKVDPYLRPLYDALFEIMGGEAFARNMEKGLIEVAPLAYMRGRTLENAYIILDEAQNTTPEQMKMFLTRFGSGSKIIVTGDVTQIDLPEGKKSGLKEVQSVLKGIPGIAFIHFSQDDVVRHRLVQRIIEAYEKAAAKHQKIKEHRVQKEHKDDNHKL